MKKPYFRRVFTTESCGRGNAASSPDSPELQDELEIKE